MTSPPPAALRESGRDQEGLHGGDAGAFSRPARAGTLDMAAVLAGSPRKGKAADPHGPGLPEEISSRRTRPESPAAHARPPPRPLPRPRRRPCSCDASPTPSSASPRRRPRPLDVEAADAFVWHAGARRLSPVPQVNRVEIGLLRGIDRVRDTLVDNTERFARGLAGQQRPALGRPRHGQVVARQGGPCRDQPHPRRRRPRSS